MRLLASTAYRCVHEMSKGAHVQVDEEVLDLRPHLRLQERWSDLAGERSRISIRRG